MHKTARRCKAPRGRLLVLTACCGLAWPALAVPPVLDYAPPQAKGVVVFNNVRSAADDMRAFMEACQLPELDGPAQMMLEEVNGQGVRADGSAAFFSMGPGELVVLLPVSDYKAFVTAHGGVGAGVEQITFGGEEVFVKPIEGGYAALSDQDWLVEGWTPGQNQRQRFVESMGPRALEAAEAADVFIVGDIAALADDWRQGYEGLKGMAMMMGGPNAQGIASLDPLVNAFLTDAQSGVVALDLGADGLTARLLSKFKEGSLLAGLFAGNSDTGDLLEHVPDVPFAMALAMDTGSPSMRSLLSMVLQNMPQDQGNQVRMMVDMINNTTGSAFVMGAPTMQEMSIGAGAFLRTAAFYRTPKPEQLKDAVAKSMEMANGQRIEQNGMTMLTTSSYKPKARTIDGVTVDEWGMQINVQGNDEQAMQAQMAMSMIYGSNGAGGYVAGTDNGLVMTMSRNSQMLTQTLQTAQQGGGLGANEQLRTIAAKLPGNRAAEIYIGVDKLLGIGAAFLGDIPPMPPVGLVAASGHGTAEIAVHVPQQVITQVMELGMMFGEMGQPGMEFEDEDDAEAPSF